MEQILTRINANRVGVTIAMSSILATWTAIFGEMTQIHKLLFAVILLDYVSGICAAIVNKNVSSTRAHIGIIKKTSIIALIAFSHQVDIYLGTSVICTGVAAFFVASEFMSVMENYKNIGLPIPDKLVKVMEVLSKKGSNG